MFTQNEITFLLDCFNGVICTPETLTGNIWGHVPFYNGAEVESINALINKVNNLPMPNKQDFVDKIVCWDNFTDAKAYLTSL